MKDEIKKHLYDIPDAAEEIKSFIIERKASFTEFSSVKTPATSGTIFTGWRLIEIAWHICREPLRTYGKNHTSSEAPLFCAYQLSYGYVQAPALTAGKSFSNPRIVF